VEFRWDAQKAKSNVAKHGVTFEEASTVFSDPLSLTIPDPMHSQVEERWIIIGLSSALRLVVVSHSERDDTIRIINARPATSPERRQYEEAN
jgi:uncharacterized DUF497 family protein